MAARAATAPAPRRAPARPAPRRKPATPRRGTTRPAPKRRVQARPQTRGAKAAARLAGIPRSPFVDRLLTGRIWIVLLAVLLAGIVFANVALLEMNHGIAQTTEKVSALKRENSRLRLEAAKLGSSERIQRAAADLGLVLPAPGEVRYLDARPGDAALALKKMTAPTTVPVYTPTPEPVTPEATTTPTTTTEPAPTTTDTTTPTTTTTPTEPVTPAPTATSTTPPTTTEQTGY